MAQVQFQPKINLDVKDIVGLVAQLEGVDLDNLKQQIDNLWMQRKAQNVSEKEAKLIGALATELSPNERKRQVILSKKVDTETLTAAERKELNELFDKGQADYLRRLEAAKSIAELRGEEFKAVAEEFGLLNPANV